MKNGGYEIKKYRNPFDIELEKTPRGNNTDEDNEVDDLEEEEVIFLEDDVDDSNCDNHENDEFT